MNEVYYKKIESHTTKKYKDHYDLSENYFDESDEDDLFGLNFNQRRSLFSLKQDYHPSALKWDVENVFHTKEKFDENFNNLLCNIHCNRLQVIVNKSEEKVSLKIFSYTKGRDVNKPYYKVFTECRYLTYSVKKNVFYLGKITNYHKKRKYQKTVKVIGFANDFVNDLILNINLNASHIFKSIPSENVNSAIGHEALMAFAKSIPNAVYDKQYSVFENLYKFYLESRGVKIPNNWYVFSGKYPQPIKKNIIKNKFKLIETMMDVNKLKGDKVKKVLHLVENFNVSSLKSAYNFFGFDFIHSQPDEVVKQIVESKVIDYEMNYDFQFISKKERNNAFEIFKLVINDEINRNTFLDHSNMIKSIRRFETAKWEANSYVTFLEEHLNLTEKVQFYTKGVFKRIYSDDFINYVELPLTSSGTIYHPKVLTNSNEYNTESFVQSNCVKGYINKCSSLIISLRKDDLESKERATIEIRISKGDKINFKRVQTLGRFNKVLDSEWSEVLDILDSRLRQSISLNLFELPKIECKVGYQTFTSDSHFVNYNNSELSYHLRPYGDKEEKILGWVEKGITNIDSHGNNAFIQNPQIVEEDF